MELFSALVLVLASNLDTLSLGFAYAARGIRIPLWQQALIAVSAAAFTFIALGAGQAAMRFLPQTALSFCERYSDRILGFLLILLGAVQCLRG